MLANFATMRRRPLRSSPLALVALLALAGPLAAQEPVAVEGTGFTVQELREGAMAFSNRRYLFEDVPKALVGWEFTRLDGGARPELVVRAPEGRFVYLATVPAQDGINLKGWQAVREWTFVYTDKGRSRLAVYRRRCGTEPLQIPQGNWSGGIVLAPKLTATIRKQKVDFALVPGVVVSHSPAKSRHYVGSPSIAILPDGGYVATHDLFGRGAKKSRTRVFGSTDRGANWTHLADVDGQVWSSLFAHGEALYLMGTSKHYGAAVIRRSGDGGRTWTEPRDRKTGLLLDDVKYACGPGPVVVHAGRIWRAMEDAAGPGGWGRRFRAFMMSAPVDADLLDAASWTSTNRLKRNGRWLGGKFGGWLEGNAVVTPDGDLVNVLRVDFRPRGGKAAVIRIDAAGRRASFDPATGFVDFPGGCKKFTIRYDPVSEHYWSLSNYIPPRHRGGNPERTRNTLALVRSRDLRNWEVRSIVLYHPDTARHAFQYIDWQFDGDDLVAVSRTAFDDGLGGAKSQHDANFLTFHRVRKFRDATAKVFGK